MTVIQKVKLKKGFTVRNIIELVTVNERFRSEIYFVKDHLKCNGKSLLGLMSLLLVTKIGEEYEIIIQGEDAKLVIEYWNVFLERMDGHNLKKYNYEHGAVQGNIYNR